MKVILCKTTEYWVSWITFSFCDLCTEIQVSMFHVSRKLASQEKKPAGKQIRSGHSWLAAVLFICFPQPKEPVHRLSKDWVGISCPYDHDLIFFWPDGNARVDGTESCIGLKPKLEELVQFIWGHPYLPSCGYSMKVRFTRGCFPDPESCFNTIKLPLAHSSYESFERAMDIAIKCQHVGYARGWWESFVTDGNLLT